MTTEVTDSIILSSFLSQEAVRIFRRTRKYLHCKQELLSMLVIVKAE